MDKRLNSSSKLNSIGNKYNYSDKPNTNSYSYLFKTNTTGKSNYTNTSIYSSNNLGNSMNNYSKNDIGKSKSLIKNNDSISYKPNLTDSNANAFTKSYSKLYSTNNNLNSTNNLSKNLSFKSKDIQNSSNSNYSYISDKYFSKLNEKDDFYDKDSRTNILVKKNYEDDPFFDNKSNNFLLNSNNSNQFQNQKNDVDIYKTGNYTQNNFSITNSEMNNETGKMISKLNNNDLPHHERYLNDNVQGSQGSNFSFGNNKNKTHKRSYSSFYNTGTGNEDIIKNLEKINIFNNTARSNVFDLLDVNKNYNNTLKYFENKDKDGQSNNFFVNDHLNLKDNNYYNETYSGVEKEDLSYYSNYNPLQSQSYARDNTNYSIKDVNTFNLSNSKSHSGSSNNKILKKRTLVLDLDETLVHAFYDSIPDFDFAVDIKYNSLNNVSGIANSGSLFKKLNVGKNSVVNEKIYIKIRPHTIEFLEKVSSCYELMVFTASVKEYAKAICENLERLVNESMKKKISKGENIGKNSFKFPFKFELILSRKNCSELPNGSFSKDLSLIGRDLKDVIIIDVRFFKKEQSRLLY